MKKEENKIVAGVKKFFSGIVNYLRESRAELRKVQWPNRKETSAYTAVVIAISLGIAGFIWVVDQGVGFILKLLIA